MRGCSILLLKKGKGPWDRIPFFFNDSDIFKNILILIITSLAIHYSQNVFLGFSILVCIGVQVFFGGFLLFFTPPLAHVARSRTRLALTSVWPKNAKKIEPVLQIQAFSMKLRVHRFFFLVFLHIKTDCKNKLFFYKHINIQIRRFFSELVESESCGKYCLIMIRIGMNTALLAFSRSLGM